MIDLLENLISNWKFAFLVVFALSILFYTTFRIVKLKPHNNIKLDYYWIFIGLLAVLVIVEDNKKAILFNKIEFEKKWIEHNYTTLKMYLSSNVNCINYQYNQDFMTKEHFDSIQIDRESYCKWSQEFLHFIDSISSIHNQKIGEFKKIDLFDSSRFIFHNDIYETIENINNGIEEIKTMEKQINNNDYKNFKNTIGLLFVYLAFSIKFASIAYKVYLDKSRIN